MKTAKPGGRPRLYVSDGKVEVFHRDALLGVIDMTETEACRRLLLWPALLAACEQAEDCIDPTAIGGQLALEMVRAVLAKVKGSQT